MARAPVIDLARCPRSPYCHAGLFEPLPRLRHSGERRVEPQAPTRSARGGVAIGFDEIVGPILGQSLDQKRRLSAVLDGFEAVRPVLATIGDYEFVNCKPLGARNLNQHAAAIRHGGGDRIGDQEIQMMERLRLHVERRQRPHAFGFVKARRQKLDQEIAARLAPTPGFLALKLRRGLERKILQNGLQRRRSLVVERERQALETGDVDIVCLRGLIEVVTKAEFAFVETEGLRADDRPAKPEDAGLRESVEKRAGRCVDAEEPLGAQNADFSRPGRLRLRAPGDQFTMAGEARADFVAILADIRLAHVRADAKRVVPVDLAVANDAGRRAAQFGDSLVFQGGDEVEIGGVRDGGMATDHVQRDGYFVEHNECSTKRQFR